MDNDALRAAAKPLVLPEFVTPPGEIDITNAQGIGDDLQGAIEGGEVIAGHSGHHCAYA